jgi:hypothetical protein
VWYRLPSLTLDIPMHDNLSGRAAELAHLTDLIRTSLSLADAAIPLINEQLNGLAEMGIDNPVPKLFVRDFCPTVQQRPVGQAIAIFW